MQVQFNVGIHEVIEKREEPCLAVIKREAEVAAAMERRETDSTGKIQCMAKTSGRVGLFIVETPSLSLFVEHYPALADIEPL